MIAIITAFIAILSLAIMSFILLKKLDKKANNTSTELSNEEEPVEEEIDTDNINSNSNNFDINRQSVSFTIDRI